MLLCGYSLHNQITIQLKDWEKEGGLDLVDWMEGQGVGMGGLTVASDLIMVSRAPMSI